MKKKQTPMHVKSKFLMVPFLAFVLCLSFGFKSDNGLIPGYTLGTTVNNVDCYYKIENCEGKNKVFLIFNNKNSSSVKVTWMDRITDKSGKTIPTPVAQKELLLQSGTTAMPPCNGEIRKDVIVIDDDLKTGDPLSYSYKFELLTVSYN